MTELIVQQLVNWVTLGCIYALLAIGFSLIFGVLNVIHFSHGDVAMTSPFIALAAAQALAIAIGVSGPVWLIVSACIAVFAVGLIGVILDKVVIRRFRDAPAMMALVATVALGIVIRELIRHLYPQGSNPHAFPRLASGVALEIAGVQVGWFTLLVVALTLVLVVLLFAFLRLTPLGLRIRAASEDRIVARMMGIRDTRVFRATFFVASAIGAIAGLLFASYAGVTRFDFGVMAGLLGFSAAVIGGLGSMPGAILGGLIIAGIEVLAQTFVPDGASYRLVFVFLLVIGVLLFRPEGLLGRPVMVKV
ncbi:MAG: branched-chain amino acid ABC transporter permease [Aquamicrobium sp.]|jgi:branched-chain amino acid transport system permease protein|nr:MULTISPECIES: branched-chain amino acid ABC transporter permease [Mesorhizobium]MBR2689426.1 branched-chain amino acid ABC transporter permease [Aquamicrobium sp.]QAZ42033.1 branched-chain amino acid ABC transporter permease [Mesorhizobium sp. Pch-S]